MRGFLLLLCSLPAIAGFGHSPRYFNYSVEQGLPSSETYDVMQDSKGFIWIATDRGAARYNGYEFKIFTTNDGLPVNTVFSFTEDHAGRIWFLNFSHHLAYYENGKIHLYKYNHVLEKKLDGVPNPNPRSLYIDKKENLYVGYDGYGLIHIDPFGQAKQLMTDDPKVKYKCFVKRIGGTDLYGSMKCSGSRRFKFEADQYQSGGVEGIGYVSHPVHIKRKNGAHITAIGKKLIECDPTNGMRTYESDIFLIGLSEDRDSCLWVCRYRGGAKRLFPRSMDRSRYQCHVLQDKSVTDVLQDDEGGFWFSTMENGVYYFPQFRILPVGTPMQHEEVSAITSEGNSPVFVGYTKGVVEELHGISYVRSHYIKLSQDYYSYIHSLQYDPAAGRLWCATWMGIQIFPDQEIGKKIPWGVSRSIYFVNSDSCYFTSNKGLICYHSGQITNLAKTARKLHIEAICPNDRGNILLGALNGLYIYHTREKKLEHAKGILGRVRIKEIRNPGNGLIIYATLGEGVVLEKKGKLQIVNEKRGLASNLVNAITSNDDTLWAATPKGISRIMLKDEQVIIHNFDQYNGLPTNEIKKIHQQGDIVWLGTREGLHWFRASQVLINQTGPKVFLEQLVVNEKPVQGQHEFSAQENNMSFHFFAINYKKRGTIQYRYRMQGYDNTWKYTQNRSVQYLSLPSGQYAFEVQAENEDHYWSATGAVFRFTIFKPFYFEWWFILLTSLLLAGIIYLLVRRRIKAIRRHNEMLLLMNEYKGIALAAQINPHFIFNSLNSIQSFILYEDRINASKYLSAFARLMRKSLDHSRVDFVTIKDEIELLEMYLALEQLRFKNKFDSVFNIDPQIALSGVLVPSMILQPFIENSIRHGLIPREGNEGRVTIGFSFEGNLLKCTIDDNGVGRQRTVGKNREGVGHISYGIDITVERIKAYCKQEKTKFHFEIEDKLDESAQPAGTKVIFYLPYRKVQHEIKMPDHR